MAMGKVELHAKASSFLPAMVAQPPAMQDTPRKGPPPTPTPCSAYCLQAALHSTAPL